MEQAPDGWVIDGNYDSKLGDLVVDEADTIVWLDLPLSVKWFRLWRRTMHRIRNEIELWNGNRETWRGAFAEPRLDLRLAVPLPHSAPAAVAEEVRRRCAARATALRGRRPALARDRAEE